LPLSLPDPRVASPIETRKLWRCDHAERLAIEQQLNRDVLPVDDRRLASVASRTSHPTFDMCTATLGIDVTGDLG